MSLQSGIGSGPSIPLFDALYERNCITFDHVWAWEYTKHDPKDWWAPVPLAMRAKLTFFNFGVSHEPPQWKQESFLEFLKASARPDDFVVLKVDIDNSEIELSIVHAIVGSEELSQLVDELYFEYHFRFDMENFGWGDSHKNQTVDDALALMQQLRKRGILAHFWI